MERVRPTGPVEEVLNDEQKRVLARVIREEEGRREHVVVYLSGGHAYGFPSPDSDLDLKAIHVAKTAASQEFEIVHNSSIRRGIGRHRSITGRHATSRDLRSARQPQVNEKFA